MPHFFINSNNKTDNKIAKWIYLEDGGVAYEVSSDVVNMSFYNYDNRIVLLDGIISDAHGILTSELFMNSSAKVNSGYDDIATDE